MSFYGDYKVIRNQIRAYDPVSITGILITISHDLSTKKPTEWNGYLPWVVLLLLKWVLANYESVNTKSINKSAVQADIQVVNKFLNQLHELFQKYRTDALTTNDNNKIAKFMRQIAFQQIWFQTKLSTETFARQFHLFCNRNNLTTESVDKIDSLFKNRTGISVFSFFEISFMVWAKFHADDKKEPFITKEWFINCKHSFAENELEAYFKLLSLPFEDAKKYANSDILTKKDYSEFQIWEQSPFTFHPFLEHEDKYFLYSPYLLDYVIKYYVYDFLKLNDGSSFAGIFGMPIFENYLAAGLVYSGVDFLDEQTLSKKLPKNSKKVDFLIEIGSNAVLIDAKASEMHSLARATQNNESIIKALEKSVIKGMQQAYTVANTLTNKNKIYAIIVTYKELYLGTVGAIWEEFLEESLSGFFTETGISPDIIKPENIYVLSIEEFDNLMKCIKNDNNNLIKILDHASAEDKNPGQGKYVFNWHLKGFFPEEPEILPYLNNKIDELFESMENRFKN